MEPVVHELGNCQVEDCEGHATVIGAMAAICKCEVDYYKKFGMGHRDRLCTCRCHVL